MGARMRTRTGVIASLEGMIARIENDSGDFEEVASLYRDVRDAFHEAISELEANRGKHR